jgi:hypothetical protein
VTPSLTIVSACDRNFLWGAFLLAASVHRQLPQVPFLLLETGFQPEDQALIKQFPGAQIRSLSSGNRRNVCNRKPEAILSADTEFIAWLDSDCMVLGDLSELLIPTNGEFQIRLREPNENADVWSRQYQPGDKSGELPRAVAARWQADVGERTEARLQTTCVTNVFVLHRRHLNFIQRWQEQIHRILPSDHAGPVDSRLLPYFMTDESVLSSLLAFAHNVPPLSPSRLHIYPKAHVAHFGTRPKPWKRWRLGAWYCYEPVMELLDWVRAQGWQTPPLPWSFQRRYRLVSHLWALADEQRAQLRRQAIAQWRRFRT